MDVTDSPPSAKLADILNSYMTPPWNDIDTASLTQSIQNTPRLFRYDILQKQNINGYTVLHFAAYWGHNHLIHCLLDQLTEDECCNLLLIQDYFHNTVLHSAARWGHSDTLKSLLNYLPAEKQFDLLKVQNINGDTSLHCASYFGQTLAVRRMLECLNENDQLELLNIGNKDGKTAFALAVEEDVPETATCLQQFKTATETVLRRFTDFKDGNLRRTADELMKLCQEMAAQQARMQLKLDEKDASMAECNAKLLKLQSNVDELKAMLSTHTKQHSLNQQECKQQADNVEELAKAQEMISDELSAHYQQIESNTEQHREMQEFEASAEVRLQELHTLTSATQQQMRREVDYLRRTVHSLQHQIQGLLTLVYGGGNITLMPE